MHDGEHPDLSAGAERPEVGQLVEGQIELLRPQCSAASDQHTLWNMQLHTQVRHSGLECRAKQQDTAHLQAVKLRDEANVVDIPCSQIDLV